MVTPSHLAGVTFVNGKSLIGNVGEIVIVPNLCPDPMKIKLTRFSSYSAF